MVLIAVITVNPSDGYHHRHSNKQQIVEYHVKYNTTTNQNPPEADHFCGRGKGKPTKKGLPL